MNMSVACRKLAIFRTFIEIIDGFFNGNMLNICVVIRAT